MITTFKDMYTRDEIVTIYDNAQTYGGSFMQALTTALLRADAVNQIKLVDAYKQSFDEYLNF